MRFFALPRRFVAELFLFSSFDCTFCLPRLRHAILKTYYSLPVRSSLWYYLEGLSGSFVVQGKIKL